MPVKEIEKIVIKFTFDGEEYELHKYLIYKGDMLVCAADLTGTEYYGDKDIMLLCCKVALKAYYNGIKSGIKEHKLHVSKTLKSLIGL